MTKLEKIDKELSKAREKAAEWQAKIRDLEKQRQEEENSMIVQAVRSLKLTPAELAEFFSNPGITASGQLGPKSDDVRGQNHITRRSDSYGRIVYNTKSFSYQTSPSIAVAYYCTPVSICSIKCAFHVFTYDTCFVKKRHLVISRDGVFALFRYLQEVTPLSASCNMNYLSYCIE